MQSTDGLQARIIAHLNSKERSDWLISVITESLRVLLVILIFKEVKVTETNKVNVKI